MLAFGLKQGAMTAYGMLISDLYSPFGLSAKLLSIYTFCFFFIGILGAVCFGVYVDRTKKVKCTMVTIGLLGAVSVVLVSAFIHDILSWRLSIALFISTFASVPFMPMAFNFAQELTFPVNPAVINGGMMIAMNVSIFI